MEETEYELVEPRQKTERDLKEHYEMEHGGQIEIEETRLENEGETLVAEFSCPDCSLTVSEVYLLRRIERLSDGETWGPNEIPSCECDEEYFNAVRYYKPYEDEAIAEAKCGNCGTKFADHFKFEHTTQN